MNAFQNQVENDKPCFSLLGNSDERGHRIASFVLGLVLWMLAATSNVGLSEDAKGLPDDTLTYGPTPQHMLAFGQWLVWDSDAHEYRMYVSFSSAIVDGHPAVTKPGDQGTFNETCKSWWADRIWLMRHTGDGKDPAGWSKPELQLNIGGAGESALIGDPCVVHWHNRWHMYYEGTDRCDGGDNLIFHAVADSPAGPWHKQGAVVGLLGNFQGSGLSWPTILVDGDWMLMYYTNTKGHLLCAKTKSADGQSFQTVSLDANRSPGKEPMAPVVAGEWVNRAQVVKYGQRYLIVYDAKQRTKIKVSESDTPLHFSKGKEIAIPDPQRSWKDFRVGLPCYLQVGKERRIYYTGESTNGPGRGGIGVISFSGALHGK